MKINLKILIITVSILFISLLIGSIVNIINFRKNYTEALITGSYGLGYSLSSVVTELLNLGLPLDSFSGMDKKCSQLAEQNPHISYVCIHDLTGKTLYHSDPAALGRVLAGDIMKKSIAATKPLTQFYHRFDGHDYYDITIPIFTAEREHAGLLRLGFRTGVINDKVVSAIIQVVINLAASFVLITLMINYFISHFVSEPVIRLSEHARRIAEGNYDIEAEAGSHDEVGTLSEVFNHMTATIKKQMDELRKSRDDLEMLVSERTKKLDIVNNELNEELLKREADEQALRKANSAIKRQLSFTETLLRAMPIAAFYKDTKGRYLGCNKEFSKLVGVTPEAIVGKTVFEVWSSEQAETFHRKDSELLQKPAYQIYEYTLTTNEGTPLDVICYKDVFMDENGMVSGIIGTFVDITARKKAEERIKQSLKEKEALLREIHHRVKNNMAVVSSLLSLQAGKITDAAVKQVFVESRQRVKSMALVHEKLYQTEDLSSVDFKDYIKSIVSEIISLYRIDTGIIRTEINIQDIELDLESAVPCGLIINELLTNAFKYAFPDNRSGVLSINFTKIDGSYTLTIRDNGVGLPEGFDYKKTDTLGLQLVNILTGQLKGILQIKSDNGTEAVITFTGNRGLRGINGK